jgi:glucose/arabinose dehydrogenase
MSLLRRTSTAFATLALATCAGTPQQPGLPPEGQGELRVDLVASGLSDALYLTAPAGDPRLFIVEQAGRIRIVQNGQLVTTSFLDINAVVRSGGEQGLLSVAFHPSYATNGYFYVNYTDNNGDTRVERYTVSANANVADPGSGKLLLLIEQPYANHNGGLVMFGPDGMLYVGMGDGGGAGDPMDNGQNPGTLLGKLLRIDVDHGDPYIIPADNPFVGRAGARGEIWATGMRNPWRFAFDQATGLLYVADVGQNRWEEIDIVPASRGGLNYGWNLMEGADCYADPGCKSDGLVLPALAYGHADGCSITGGFVYRGRASPSLVGQYFYSDYCSGWIRSFTYSSPP